MLKFMNMLLFSGSCGVEMQRGAIDSGLMIKVEKKLAHELGVADGQLECLLALKQAASSVVAATREFKSCNRVA